MCLSWFFFQAEDGIRDLVRSRGLGDVYKRQDGDRVVRALDPPFVLLGHDVAVGAGLGVVRHIRAALGVDAVSYTHLTLPTSDLV